jgi:hypothetical protein
VSCSLVLSLSLSTLFSLSSCSHLYFPFSFLSLTQILSERVRKGDIDDRSTREDGDGKANQRKVSERVRKGDIDDRSTREDGD